MMLRTAAIACLVFGAVGPLYGEVTKWEITKREPYAAGQPRGERGVYERWTGKVHFAIDPANAFNKSVVDLPLAPRNDQGRVEFSADFEMLVPADRSRANGAVFYEVNNRGNKTAPGVLDGGADDFLCRQGYVVLWSGWIAEVQPGGERLRLRAPLALENGKPLRGIVRNELVVDKLTERASIAHRGNQGAYPPVNEAFASASVTRRERESDPRQSIPRAEWDLIVSEVEGNGERGQLPQMVLQVGGGLKPGWIYEVIYEAEGSLVQGVGLAGIRDILSSLKHGGTHNPLQDKQGQPLVTRAIGFGTSQSGRALRQFLWDGFNADEQGRKVFDGVIAHVAGGGLGSFNHRFASPNRTNGQHEEHLFPADFFPFTYGEEADPFTGERDGILRKCQATGTLPKVFHTQSTSEYWHRSGSLAHTDPWGSKDAEIPANVRFYTFGGTQHGAGSGVPGPKGNGTQPTSPADYRPLMRGLLTALDAWVQENVEPPPSVYPRIADGTLVGWRPNESGWPAVPGVQYPQVIQTPPFLYRGPEWASRRIASVEPPEIRGQYVVKVPAIGPNGNERGTLNLPAITVPVGSYTSWNLRDSAIGAAGALLSLQGSYIPFAGTQAEREAAKDPRPSLAELYPDYADYEAKYLKAAEKLAAERYLLAEDLPRLKALCEKFKPLFEARPVAAAAAPVGELSQKLAAAKFTQYAAAPGYSEGPTWFKGEVFFCSGALLRVAADGKVHKHLDLGPAGTVLRGDGHLLICDNKHKALLDFSPDGKVTVIADQWEGKPLRSLNDLTIDSRGNVYWTDPEGSTPQTPVGSVFRLRPDGRVDRVATGMAFPNGLDVDPASKNLFVIESQSKKILRFALPDDDSLCGPAELFYDLGGSGGDGCAFDAAGNLWVADFHRPESGTGRITVLSPQAQVLGYLPVPAKVVSNIAFGGKDHDEIFCTTGDPPGVFHAKVGVKGFAGHPGQASRQVRPLNVVVQRPHADGEALREIAKLAAKANLASGKFSDETRRLLQLQLAKLTDAELRGAQEKLLPQLEEAAARANRDRALLAEVKRLGGKVTQEVAAPDWLRSIAGDEALPVFARVVEINLNERTDGHKDPEAKLLSQRTHDETLKLLVGQDSLRRLELSGTAVTSAGLMHLKDLTGLQFLNVCLTAVDDQGLAHLAALKDMRRMTVCSSKVTGSGFKSLGGMTQLESINLHSSPASDAGLEAIGKLASLKRLEIVHTHVTDAGLAHLAGLVNLRQLHIHGPETTATGLPFLAKLQELYELDIYDKPASNQSLAQIAKLPKLRMLRLFNGVCDDEGVKQLAGLTTLEDLTLGSSQVTDAALEHLAGLKRLRTIHLSGTRVTDAGKARLKTLLPQVQIVP